MRNRRASTFLMTMMTVLALVLAPVIVAATHGPAAMMAAAETAAHGHSHGDDGGLWSGHDATDHDHQLAAILTPGAKEHERYERGTLGPGALDAESRAVLRPRRPPRA